MKVLTVKQPWAWAIIYGRKDVENRPWGTDYRGPVAIHAGLRWDYEAFHDDRIKEALDRWGLSRETVTGIDLKVGVILGVVDLVGVHDGPHPSEDRFQHVGSCFQPRKPFGLCSPWGQVDQKHLTLANPRPLDEPIPWKGALGLREIPIDFDSLLTSASSAPDRSDS